MSWLTITEYHLSRICWVCHHHNSILSSCMTYHRVCNMNITIGATNGTGTAYPSGAPELTPGFKRDSCGSIISFLWSVLGIIICPFVLFRLAILVTSFGLFKLFLAYIDPSQWHIFTYKINITNLQGAVVVMIVWYMDLQLPMQSVLITTDVMGSNLDLGEVYNIMW